MVDALLALSVAEPRRLRKQTPLEIAALIREEGGAHHRITDAFGDIRQRSPPKDSFGFWKGELNGRVLEEPGVAREHWLGGYAYAVGEWTTPFDAPLLEVMRCE